MNILELDSYNLADAVKFNEQLNPRIWQGNQMRPQVRAKLLQIAEDFKQSLGLTDLNVKDITLSGSNASYTYTPHSDIDLHLVVDLPEADASEVYRELFDAKKFQYNETHNIKIGGYDVELYVENANTPPVSQGMFSVLHNDWINIPLKKRSTVNDNAVKSKYDMMQHRIESAIKSANLKRLTNTAAKIKKMRQSGLDKHGELGPENIAYKMLRSQGVIKQLYDARTAAKDQELSLRERTIQVKQPFRYGFKTTEDVSSNPSGVSPETKMFLSEKPAQSQQEIVTDFVNYCVEQLGIEQQPTIKFKRDPEWSARNKTFGRYNHETNLLEVSLANRHVMDILRTVAHELTHQRQHEVSDVPDHAGETGSEWENEANARAGVLMREYAQQHPEFFADESVTEAGMLSFFSPAAPVKKKWNPATDSRVISNKKDNDAWVKLLVAKHKKGIELTDREWRSLQQWYADRATPVAEGASGYIPKNNKEARDPRYSMAVTVDIKPGQVGKEANKLGLQTDSQGKPALLMKTANLQESLAAELALFEQDLFEIKMTGKNLSQLAKNIKDVRVGLEFEMIVPNVSNDDGDAEQEPDMDQDERVRDIDDAINFFDDGDYNYGSVIRNTREEMENSYQEWVSEQMDNEWWNGDQGLEYFREYLEREDPFDAEEAEEEARNELQTQYGDELDVEDFEKMLFATVDEKRLAYVQEQWDDQGRNFDRAREEFEDEQRENYSEQDWLRSQDIHYASEVQNVYSDLVWPYWTSTSNDGDNDVKSVALDFMNAMGMDTVAVSNSYHGSYEKWNGSDWVRIGNNKPDDAFTIEPDGSLDGDNDDDVGLEFVSPPIPLEDIGTVMSKVQNWAGNYGAYTGLNNKTSMHTNISVPGYDLDKLDYVKAALLLGDEHVLREFERFGNTYAKPAIEKVRQLVKAKPEKAQELLDKMKSQLNAEASKLIHSGQTDKFTSINTKNNRIEYRSPGGDYLSDIADNPKKLIDTINRMVVTMDAAMDPEKYKQEYQKKLYKLLTGQESGREGATGEKKEMKANDKDLLNIFSRYAAGELPRAALKSFVRQAQLERKGKSGKETAQSPAQQGNWGIWATSINRFVRAPGQIDNSVLRRFPSREAAEQFLAQTRAERPDMRTDIEVREIEPAAQTQPSVPAYLVSYELDDGQSGRERVQAANADAAMAQVRLNLEEEGYEVVSIEAQAASAPSPAAPVPGSTLDLQRQRAAQALQGVDTRVDYELYNRTTGAVIDTFPARNDDEARVRLDDFRNFSAQARQNPDLDVGVRRGPGVTNAAPVQTPDQAHGGVVDVAGDDWDADFERAMQQSAQASQTLTRPGQGQQTFTGQWKVLVNGEEVYRFGGVGNNQGDANRVAAHWLRNNGMGVSGEGFEVYPVMSEA